MLYHNLMEWMEQEEAEADPNFFQRMKKGVAFVPIRKQTRNQSITLITEYTPVFIELQKDGIPVHHYRNPVTGENDITMVVFDNRVLKATAPTGNTLSTMDMAKYHEVVEQMSKR